MGHEYIDYEGRFEQFQDMEIWVMRHFLIEEAHSMCHTRATDQKAIHDLCRHLEGWDWLGPGVWQGLNLSEFVLRQETRRVLLEEVLRGAAGRIEAFGDEIPLEYLQSQVDTPTAYHTAAEPKGRFIDAIGRIRGMLLVRPG